MESIRESVWDCFWDVCIGNLNRIKTRFLRSGLDADADDADADRIHIRSMDLYSYSYTYCIY